MSTDPMLPGIAEQIPDPLPEPCTQPFFLVAYWPRGGWWTVHPELHTETHLERARAAVRRLQQAGWTHVTWLELPEVLWARPDPIAKSGLRDDNGGVRG